MRKRRIGEIVCRCAAYEFPHRFSGGRCGGRHLVDQHWEDSFGGGVCKICILLVDEDGIAACQVVEGAEAPKHCPVWQEFVARHEVRLGSKYG